MLTEKQKELQNIDLSQYSPRERASIRLYGFQYKDWTHIDAVNHYHEWLPYAHEVEVPMADFDEALKWCHDNLYVQDAYAVPNTRGHTTHALSTGYGTLPKESWGTISFKSPEDAFIFKLRYS